MRHLTSYIKLIVISVLVAGCDKNENQSVRFILNYNLDAQDYFVTTHVQDTENIICVPYTLVDLKSKLVRDGKTYKWRDGAYHKADKWYTVFYSIADNSKVESDELLIRAVSTCEKEVPLEVVFLSADEQKKDVYYHYVSKGTHDFILKKQDNSYYLESLHVN